MRIHKMEIQGFGKLSGCELDLAPGVNVFFGENESGKSTLQASILALLYGFYESNRATKTENEQRDYYRPWVGEAYAGALEYELEDGRLIRIERNFDSADLLTKVFDLTKGREITGDFGTGRHGSIPIARQQLGMPRSVFLSSAFVSQGAITDFEDTQTVGDVIANLADTGKRDVSAVKAIERLDTAIRQDVGSDRSRVTPLVKARSRVDELLLELSGFKLARHAVQEATEARDELLNSLNGTKTDLHRATLAIIARNIEDVEDRVRRLERQNVLVAEATASIERLKDYANFPVHVSQGMARAQQSRQDAIERCARSEANASRGKAESDETCEINAYEELSATLGQLSTSEYEAIVTRNGRILDLQKEVEAKRQLLAEVRMKRVSVKPWLLIAALLLAPIGIPLLLWHRSRLKRGIENEKKTVLLQLAPLENDMHRLQQELSTTLRNYGTETLDELDARRLRFFQIGASLAEYRNLQKQAEDDRQEVDRCTVELLGMYRQAGIGESDLETASSLFEEAYARKREHDEAQGQLVSAQGQRTQILGKQAPGELSDSLDKLRRQRGNLLANHPELEGLLVEDTLEEVELERDRLEKQRETLEHEIVRREENIKAGLSAYRVGAEIEEDLARHQEQVRFLEVYRRSLEMAKETIETTAEEIHGDFAPKLAEASSESMATLTDGRYTSVYVDAADLSVTVKVPETGQVKSTAHLSMGTEEQIYLLLRVELAKLISSMHERIPLFLDDPFVHFDTPRLARVLSFLLRLSDNTQVLLFTKDDYILRWCGDAVSGTAKGRLFLLGLDGSIAAR